MDDLLSTPKKKARVSFGFTMMEMIVVMTIIGIIAAFAIPRFIDLDTEANQSAVDSIAASLNTSTAMNFAKRKANVNNPNASKYDNCSDSGALIPGGSLPSGYSIPGKPVTKDAEVVCSVVHLATGLSASYVGLGVS